MLPDHLAEEPPLLGRHQGAQAGHGSVDLGLEVLLDAELSALEPLEGFAPPRGGPPSRAPRGRVGNHDAQYRHCQTGSESGSRKAERRRGGADTFFHSPTQRIRRAPEEGSMERITWTKPSRCLAIEAPPIVSLDLIHRDSVWTFDFGVDGRDAVVVGSSPEADVSIDAPGVAPLHFHFERAGDQIALVSGYGKD